MVTQGRMAFRPSEAAQSIGVSRDTIDRLINAGQLKSFKVGAARFISAEELQRFIHEREGQES